MKTVVYLYGNPPFAMMYLKEDRFVGIDLHLFRPDPTKTLKKNKVYDAVLRRNTKGISNIQINKKNFIVYL